jgi:hypothetical protein
LTFIFMGLRLVLWSVKGDFRFSQPGGECHVDQGTVYSFGADLPHFPSRRAADPVETLMMLRFANGNAVSNAALQTPVLGVARLQAVFRQVQCQAVSAQDKSPAG